MAEPRVSLLAKEAAAKAAEEVGVLPQMAELNVFRALLHQPKVAKAVQDLLVSLLFRGSLDARLRELLIMRLGWQTGSVYEWTQHWRVALELGVSDQDLESKPVEKAMPNVLVQLTMASDRVRAY